MSAGEAIEKVREASEALLRFVPSTPDQLSQAFHGLDGAIAQMRAYLADNDPLKVPDVERLPDLIRKEACKIWRDGTFTTDQALAGLVAESNSEFRCALDRLAGRLQSWTEGGVSDQELIQLVGLLAGGVNLRALGQGDNNVGPFRFRGRRG